MGPGESARLEAQRAREKAERLLRYAENYERGAAGEDATARALEALPPGWVTLHDRRWPGRRLANIDHVVVGPGGIFVVDTKNWSGNVSVVQDRLRQNGYGRDKAVAGAADAALAIAEVVAPYARHVHPVLCFAGQASVAGWAHEVAVCTTDGLLPMLFRFPAVLIADQVADVVLGEATIRTMPSPARHFPTGGPRPAPRRSAARTARSPASSRRRKGLDARRLLAGVIGFVVLVTVGPTVATMVGDLVSHAVVTSVSP